MTTEPRIPEPPDPTSRYRAAAGSHHHHQPADVEHQFSLHVEREFTHDRLAAGKHHEDDSENETEDADEEDEGYEEDEEEELPRFDERYLKQPEDEEEEEEPSKAPFDPERMLGYSRTDEDLPILDMENEVLQRTLKDYNAYMNSSSSGKAGQGTWVQVSGEDDFFIWFGFLRFA